MGYLFKAVTGVNGYFRHPVTNIPFYLLPKPHLYYKLKRVKFGGFFPEYPDSDSCF